MKYNIGDKVRIKSLEWYNAHKNETDDIECSNNIWFYREMSKFCGKVMTISHVRADHYTMVEDLVGYWTDDMIETKIDEIIETKVDKNNYYKRYIGKHVVAGGDLKGTKGYIIDAKIEDEEFFGETLYLYIKNEFDGTIDKYCKDDVREIIYVEGYRDLD